MNKKRAFLIVLCVGILVVLMYSLFFLYVLSSREVILAPEEEYVAEPTNENVLCLYNKNITISGQICEYYLSKRPGAHSLGLDIPNSSFVSIFFLAEQFETMPMEQFRRYVANPLFNYTDSHPEIKITHLAIAKYLPIRVIDPQHGLGFFNEELSLISSISYLMTPELFDKIDRSKPSTWTIPNTTGAYNGTARYYVGDSAGTAGYGANSYANAGKHFSPDNYLNEDGTYKIRFVGSYLNAYSLEDVKKMIDKSVSSFSELKDSAWYIDGSDGPGPYSPYLIAQFLRRHAPTISREIGFRNISENKIILNEYDEKIESDLPLIGYIGAGTYNKNYGMNWATYSALFGRVNVSNRAIYAVTESYSAVTFNGNSSHSVAGEGTQSRIADAFSSNAFGGTAYQRSFSGAIGFVDEPGARYQPDIDFFFENYAQGLTLAESHASAVFGQRGKSIAVGDPLMRIRDERLLQPAGGFCIQNDNCLSRICRQDFSGSMRCQPEGGCALPYQFYMSAVQNSGQICIANSLLECRNNVLSKYECGSNLQCVQTNSSSARCGRVINPIWLLAGYSPNIFLSACENNYTASRVISEMQTKGLNCSTIMKRANQSSLYLWSLNITYTPSGNQSGYNIIKGDFSINRTEYLIIHCKEAGAWIPSCNPEQHTRFNISFGGFREEFSESSRTLFFMNKKIANFSFYGDSSYLINMSVLFENSVNSSGYIIIKNLTLPDGSRKTIFLERKSNISSGVCFADSSINSFAELNSSCLPVRCPGTRGEYSCLIDGNYFAVSGLRHSGVMERQLFCGDSVCDSSETCGSCSRDCGNCSVQAPVNQTIVIRNIPTTNYSMNVTSCIPSFKCTDSNCFNGTKTRTCIDLSECSSETKISNLSCVSEPAIPNSVRNSGLIDFIEKHKFSILFVLSVLIIACVVFAFFILKEKSALPDRKYELNSPLYRHD